MWNKSRSSGNTTLSPVCWISLHNFDKNIFFFFFTDPALWWISAELGYIWPKSVRGDKCVQQIGGVKVVRVCERERTKERELRKKKSERETRCQRLRWHWRMFVQGRGNKLRGSCRARSVPMAQWAGLIIDTAMAHKELLSFPLRFPHSHLLLFFFFF